MDCLGQTNGIHGSQYQAWGKACTACRKSLREEEYYYESVEDPTIPIFSMYQALKATKVREVIYREKEFELLTNPKISYSRQVQRERLSRKERKEKLLQGKAPDVEKIPGIHRFLEECLFV